MLDTPDIRTRTDPRASASSLNTQARSPRVSDGDMADALARIAAGDRGALRAVYVATSGQLFGLCLSILRDRPAAEDALQETYVSVWRRAADFNPDRGGALAWLSTIARNQAIDGFRASKARPQDPAPVSDDLPDGGATADVLLERTDTALCLHRQLDQLDPQSAWALKTAFFGELTYAELAEEAGVPLSTMKSRIHRALLQLRRTWPQDAV